MGNGSISEKIGSKLAEAGYSGDYSRVTADNYVKQASVHSCLEKLGMTSEKIVEYIQQASIRNTSTSIDDDMNCKSET